MVHIESRKSQKNDSMYDIYVDLETDNMRLQELIKRLKSDGITTLVIDHNIGFVLGIADYVNVMALGTVIATGTPSEIVENDHVIEIYLGRKG